MFEQNNTGNRIGPRSERLQCPTMRILFGYPFNVAGKGGNHAAGSPAEEVLPDFTTTSYMITKMMK